LARGDEKDQESRSMTEFVKQLSYGQLVLLCGAVTAGLVVFATVVGFALERMFGDRRRIFAIPRAEGQLRWELIGNVRFVLMAAFAFAGLLFVVPFAEESIGSIATTFFFCWFLFEVYYWCMHRLMHTNPFYRFHRYHHDSRVTSPLTGYSMSTVESLGWLVGLVGTPLLIGLVTPISLVGLLAYHVTYQVTGNIVGHANVDLFPGAISNRAASWISHPIVYHSLHHARFNNHYAFGSTFMDRIMNTEWPDWPELHAQVISGNPLRKLSARGTNT
jgi:sterol desaturase/sphingolipid hydroxylase (fatty acid hydroxylase superfamily)